MRRAALWGTAIILVHLLVNIVHGAAHARLHVDLSPAQMTFVIAVIMVCPLIAMALLWTSRVRTGLILLAASMAGSLLFGAYHHFYVLGPDHVSNYVSGFWPLAFTTTAYGLALLEAAGTYVALRFLAQ